MILRLLWAFKLELSDDPTENTWGIHPLHVTRILQSYKRLLELLIWLTPSSGFH